MAKKKTTKKAVSKSIETYKYFSSRKKLTYNKGDYKVDVQIANKSKAVSIMWYRKKIFGKWSTKYALDMQYIKDETGNISKSIKDPKLVEKIFKKEFKKHVDDRIKYIEKNVIKAKQKGFIELMKGWEVPLKEPGKKYTYFAQFKK